MQDKRLIDLKLKAERDKKLSDGAFRLLARVISDRYLDRYFLTEEAFPLPWSWCAILTGVVKDQSYRRLRELQQLGYLKAAGVMGCPPTQHFRFVVPNCRKKAPIESSKKAPINSSGKAPNHTSIPLRGRKPKERGNGKGNKEARCARRVEPNGKDVEASKVIAAMRAEVG